MKVTVNGMVVPNPENGVHLLVEVDGEETIHGPCSIAIMKGRLTIDSRGSGQPALTLTLDPELAKTGHVLNLIGGDSWLTNTGLTTTRGLDGAADVPTIR